MLIKYISVKLLTCWLPVLAFFCLSLIFEFSFDFLSSVVMGLT